MRVNAIGVVHHQYVPPSVRGRNVGRNAFVRCLPKREEEMGSQSRAEAIGQIFKVNLAVGAASVRADSEECLIQLIPVWPRVWGICELHPGGEGPVQELEWGQNLRLDTRACGSTGCCGHLHQFIA